MECFGETLDRVDQIDVQKRGGVEVRIRMSNGDRTSFSSQLLILPDAQSARDLIAALRQFAGED